MSNAFTARGWIGFDLDGTLATYDTWNGPEHIGEPILPMVSRLKAYRQAGREVRIFTARVGPQPDGFDVIAHAAIEKWCLQHLGEVLPVTATKDYGMALLYDDRAACVETNTGLVLAHP